MYCILISYNDQIYYSSGREKCFTLSCRRRTQYSDKINHQRILDSITNWHGLAVVLNGGCLYTEMEIHSHYEEPEGLWMRGCMTKKIIFQQREIVSLPLLTIVSECLHNQFLISIHCCFVWLYPNKM